MLEIAVHPTEHEQWNFHSKPPLFKVITRCALDVHCQGLLWRSSKSTAFSAYPYPNSCLQSVTGLCTVPLSFQLLPLPCLYQSLSFSFQVEWANVDMLLSAKVPNLLDILNFYLMSIVFLFQDPVLHFGIMSPQVPLDCGEAHCFEVYQ